MMNSHSPPPRFSLNRILPAVLLVCTSILAFVILVQPWSLQPTSRPLAVGDVSPQDLRAPSNIQYESQVLTDEARLAAERAVEPIYVPPEPSITRQKIERLQSVLRYITLVRENNYSDLGQKQANLGSIHDVPLADGIIADLLALSPDRWEVVQAKAESVLEQVMRDPIRSGDLDSVRQRLPSLVMVSLDLKEGEPGIVVALVSPLITANSFYSPELTEAARQAARNSVQPVIRSYIQGQTIVSRGQIITAADFEALTAMELDKPTEPYLGFLGAAVLVTISAVFVALYYFRSRSQLFKNLRSLILLVILFLVFLGGARVTIGHTIAPYLFPVSAFALLVSALFGMETGVVLGLIMSVLASYGFASDLLPYFLLTSLCGVLALGQARRIWSFVSTAGVVALAGTAVIVAYHMLSGNAEWDWLGIAQLSIAAVGNGSISIGIVLFLQFLLAQFLGLTTALQLLEISRPDFPLLKYFLQRAPGTYQHSLQVANLAEQAAESIGADGLLARVGALFHDVGKSADPLFFIENQDSKQIDSHDDMEPVAAAEAIIRHVTDGLKLAAKYRLPRRILDFIAEHHGTLVASYQYNRAVELAGGKAEQVQVGQFRYLGPTPRSRETAILMFADAVEARARAQRPRSDDEMKAIVNGVVERCRDERQLEDTPLTQRDILAVTESFLTTLRGTYHPRLEYPQEPSFEEQSNRRSTPTLPVKRRHEKRK